jgi:hypothetical protein
MAQTKQYMDEIILDIPHFSQIQDNNSGISEWERKICWLTCIKMCIEFFCSNSPSLEKLLEYKDTELVWLSLKDWTERKYTYYLPWIWWFHYWLVMIGASSWLFWRPQIINRLNTKLFFNDLLNQWNAIIASVSLWFEQREKNWWHLIVLRWIRDWKYIINDPMDSDSRDMLIEDFQKSFSWAIIVISDKNNEEFLSNKPIFITQESSGIPKNTYIHVHENESAAYSATKDFLNENSWNLISLHQNKERFLRFEIIDNDSNKIFIRVDPNRIFDDENLNKTIIERNAHIEASLLPIAFEKGIFLRNYIISKIINTSPKNIIWIHTNKLLNINDYLNKTSFVYINVNMPANSFIQTTNKDDWLKIKALNLNCLYFEGQENDWSLSDFCIREKYSYFTVESWENDTETFRMLLNALQNII